MDPFIGEIRLFTVVWAPTGWAICDGSSLQILQNQALYALIGTKYGGNGTTTFNLPDLRGRVPVGAGTLSGGSTYNVGTGAGSESVVLAATQVPAHTHSTNVSTVAANALIPNQGLFATVSKFSTNPTVNIYAPANSTLLSLDPSTISPAGGNVAHDNMQPFGVGNYCIATTGLFPTRP